LDARATQKVIKSRKIAPIHFHTVSELLKYHVNVFTCLSISSPVWRL